MAFFLSALYQKEIFFAIPVRKKFRNLWILGHNSAVVKEITMWPDLWPNGLACCRFRLKSPWKALYSYLAGPLWKSHQVVVISHYRLGARLRKVNFYPPSQLPYSLIPDTTDDCRRPSLWSSVSTLFKRRMNGRSLRQIGGAQLLFRSHGHTFLPIPLKENHCLSYFTAPSLQVYHNAHAGIFTQMMYYSSLLKMTLSTQNL